MVRDHLQHLVVTRDGSGYLLVFLAACARFKILVVAFGSLKSGFHPGRTGIESSGVKPWRLGCSVRSWWHKSVQWDDAGLRERQKQSGDRAAGTQIGIELDAVIVAANEADGQHRVQSRRYS